MDSGKAARLAGWRRTLRVVCFLYVALLLIVKAPFALSVFKVVWHWYLASLRSRPLVTKSFTSASGFALGDSLAQALQLTRPLVYNAQRTLHFTIFGLTVHGPACHCFYSLLDRFVQPHHATSASAILTKVLLDRVVLTPAVLCSLFAYLALLEGRPRDVLRTLRQKRGLILRTWLVSNAVWPFAHVFNFLYIPSEQRVLFVNVVSVGWNLFLSRVTNGNTSGRCRPEPASLLPSARVDQYKPQAR